MLGLIKPIKWSDEERLEYEKQLASVNAVLRPIAKNGSVKQLRREFLNGTITFKGDDQGRQAMERLLQLIDLFLASHIRMAVNPVISFYYTNKTNFPHLEKDDYFQEASMSIVNAVCGYNGKTRFSTYVFHAINRKLCDLVKSEESRSVVQKTANDIKKKIATGVTLDSALCDIDDLDTRVNIRFILTPSIRITKDLKMVARSTIPSDDVDSLNEVLPHVLSTMSDLQCRLIKSFLSNGDHTDVEAINPHTQKPYTRSGLRNIFNKACAKIGEALEAA